MSNYSGSVLTVTNPLRVSGRNPLGADAGFDTLAEATAWATSLGHPGVIIGVKDGADYIPYVVQADHSIKKAETTNIVQTIGSDPNAVISQNAMTSMLNARALASHTHTIANVTNLQNSLDGKANSAHTHATSQITGLANVATSGNYNDLTGRPTIPAAVSVVQGTGSSTTAVMSQNAVTAALASAGGSTIVSNVNRSAIGTATNAINSAVDILIVTVDTSGPFFINANALPVGHVMRIVIRNPQHTTMAAEVRIASGNLINPSTFNPQANIPSSGGVMYVEILKFAGDGSTIITNGRVVGSQ